jgi:hypothetical protein
VWADGGYRSTTALLAWAKEKLGLQLQNVTRSDDVTGFEVLRGRRVVERTFGWLVRNRRLARDYARLTSNSEAMIKLATIRLIAIQPAGQTRALVQRHRTRSRSSTRRGDSTRSVITHIPSVSGDQSLVIP